MRHLRHASEHLRYIEQVIGLRPGVRHYAAMNALMLPAGNVFICDTYISEDPTPSASPR